ncbi:MAG: ABC transporter substrate-binding protein [Solirubrobacteraceae bacterium]|nr:ABC transporter substrate-binding protein [Solirubrobacteraceae bacterium]
MTRSRITKTLIALSATAAFVGGCGSDDGDDTAGTADKAAIQKGGTLTGYYSEAPDSLDPALASLVNAQTAIFAAYTPLLTYKRASGPEGATLEPGLAEALPTISSDGLTYELTLRDGLQFSDGSPVEASDFEYTVKRLINLQSFGVGYYLGIDGAQKYADDGKEAGDISGIEADDATRKITIKLAEPDAQFSYKLALVYAGIVPSGTPFKDQTKKPPPGVGPFTIEDVKAGESFSFVKSKTFKALPSVPEANADRIDISVVENQRRQAQDVLANKVDFINDPPPADQLRQLREEAKGRYKEFTTNSTYYFVLNVEEKPFDNPEVRKALATAVDEGALARLFSGLLEPDCNFLPPGMTGYKKLTCPFGEPTAKPDIAKAKQMITDAGVAGQEVTVWSDDGDPSPQVANYLADTLNQIGLKAEPKSIDGQTFYESVTDQSTKAQVTVFNWFQDYPHPASFFANVDGNNITKTFNVDIGNVNDDALNALIEEGDKQLDVKAAAPTYEQADKAVVDNAFLVPYGHRKLTVITSDRIAFDNAVFSPVYSLDFASLGLKAAE